MCMITEVISHGQASARGMSTKGANIRPITEPAPMTRLKVTRRSLSDLTSAFQVAWITADSRIRPMISGSSLVENVMRRAPRPDPLFRALPEPHLGGAGGGLGGLVVLAVLRVGVGPAVAHLDIAEVAPAFLAMPHLRL